MQSAQSDAASRRAPDAQSLVEHHCPICGASRWVTPGRAYFAYGRQLCCGPDCEAERRRRERAPFRRTPGYLPG
jgi:hypothetical protein